MKKSILALFIFLAALALWIPAQGRLLATRRELLASQARLADLRNRAGADQSFLESARRQQKAQSQARVQAAAAVGRARQALAKLDPDSQWASPPASLPDWNPKSPYIWVPKDSLARLHPAVFDAKGAITRETASVLAIDEPARRALNDQLQRALADYHALQASNAQVSDQPADDSTADGPVVTVRVAAMPEQGAQFRTQIGQILQQNLGDQRAGLVTNAAADWLDNLSGQGSLIVSVTLHPDGTCHTYQAVNGNTTVNNGITAGSARYDIPDYLLPLFGDLLAPSTEDP
jgi:hypothetical protein